MAIACCAILKQNTFTVTGLQTPPALNRSSLFDPSRPFHGAVRLPRNHVGVVLDPLMWIHRWILRSHTFAACQVTEARSLLAAVHLDRTRVEEVIQGLHDTLYEAERGDMMLEAEGLSLVLAAEYRPDTQTKLARTIFQVLHAQRLRVVDRNRKVQLEVHQLLSEYVHF